MRVALPGVEGRRGAFLPDLLVAALQRAIALAQMDGVALAVAQHLDLDMARLLEIFLDIDGVVAEIGLGLGPGGGERDRELLLAAHDLHALAAAAGGSLDDHRKADLLADPLGLLIIGDPAFGAGHARDTEALGGALGLDLVAHAADMLRLGADEGDVVLVEDLGEARILREKAVAGMHRVGAGDLAGGDQGGNVEIAVARRGRADADALIGEADMHGVGVGSRVNRDGGDAEFLRGAQDAQRDLSPVGDQDLVEHLDWLARIAAAQRRAHSITRSGSPYSTGCPSSTMMAMTVPERGATMSLKVFIASTSSRRSPALTTLPISTNGLASGEGRR